MAGLYGLQRLGMEPHRKLEYAKQAGKLNVPVLYVNSVCLDQADACGAARGGAALFENGFIKEELPAGQEGILIVEA